MHAEAEATGRVIVHPFDDRAVMAGQGTLGLELCEQVEEVTQVVVPVGGGGPDLGRRDRRQGAGAERARDRRRAREHLDARGVDRRGRARAAPAPA